MRTVTYESLRADEAWQTVSSHLQRRNDLMTAAITYLETRPAERVLAGKLAVLHYHLRATVRQLVRETAALRPTTDPQQQMRRQWMVVHQMHYLLSQIDDQLLILGRQSADFRRWREKRTLSRRVLQARAVVNLPN